MIVHVHWEEKPVRVMLLEAFWILCLQEFEGKGFTVMNLERRGEMNMEVHVWIEE